MSSPSRLVQKWHALTGKDAGHSARVNRTLQVRRLSEVGKRGKAGLLSCSALTYFVLADVTGDSIADAPDRAELWAGLVKRPTSNSSSGRLSEAHKAFQNRMSAVSGTEPSSSILPGETLRDGIMALLDAMADQSFNIPLSGGMAPFTQIVSHMQLKIELRTGDAGGPVAIVSTMYEQNRYSLKVEQATARYPVKSVTTIEVPHLAVLASLWAETKALQDDAIPLSPPDGSASPAGSGGENENAEAIPTASAPTSSSNLSGVYPAQANPVLHTPEVSARACTFARAAKDDFSSLFAGKHPYEHVSAERQPSQAA